MQHSYLLKLITLLVLLALTISCGGGDDEPDDSDNTDGDASFTDGDTSDNTDGDTDYTNENSVLGFWHLYDANTQATDWYMKQNATAYYMEVQSEAFYHWLEADEPNCIWNTMIRDSIIRWEVSGDTENCAYELDLDENGHLQLAVRHADDSELEPRRFYFERVDKIPDYAPESCQAQDSCINYNAQ